MFLHSLSRTSLSGSETRLAVIRRQSDCAQRGSRGGAHGRGLFVLGERRKGTYTHPQRAARGKHNSQPCLASAQWSASRRVSPSRAAQVERDWSITPIFRAELAELRQRYATLKVVQRHGAGHRRLGLRRCLGGLCFHLDTWGDTRKCRNAGRQCAATPSASCRLDKAHCNPPIPHSLHQSSGAWTIAGGWSCVTECDPA